MEEAEEIGEERGEKKAWEKAALKIRELESKIEEKDRQFVINLLRKDYDIDQIHELTNVSLDKIREIKRARNDSVMASSGIR